MVLGCRGTEEKHTYFINTHGDSRQKRLKLGGSLNLTEQVTIVRNGPAKFKEKKRRKRT